MVVDRFTPPAVFVVLFPLFLFSYFTLLLILFSNGLFIKEGKVCNCARETQSVSVEREKLGRREGTGF